MEDKTKHIDEPEEYLEALFAAAARWKSPQTRVAMYVKHGDLEFVDYSWMDRLDDPELLRAGFRQCCHWDEDARDKLVPAIAALFNAFRPALFLEWELRRILKVISMLSDDELKLMILSVTRISDRDALLEDLKIRMRKPDASSKE